MTDFAWHDTPIFHTLAAEIGDPTTEDFTMSTSSLARFEGVPVVEFQRIPGTDCWSVLLVTGVWRIASAHDITAEAVGEITEDDILTARQWEVEPEFDQALDDAEWALEDRRCGLVGLVVVAAWSALTFVGLGVAWMVRAGVL